MNTFERLIEHLNKWEDDKWDADMAKFDTAELPTDTERMEESIRWLCELWDV